MCQILRRVHAPKITARKIIFIFIAEETKAQQG